ncbi:hypothetical protein JXA32_08790 [Candidatus Sumerlaeota bacterium]|nr:hypothetical protein [Candidatus Sumerlaeota bacterium]
MKNLRFHTAAIGENQVYINASLVEKDNAPAETSTEVYQRLAGLLSQKNLKIVHERIFGSASARSGILAIRKDFLRQNGVDEEPPLTYIQSDPPWGEGFSGLQVCAVAADDVWTIDEDGVPCGRGWKQNGATYIMLQNMHGRQATEENGSNGDEAARMFDRVEAILHTQGASYRNVVRTWIYFPDVLGWYDEFNAVRNAKYTEFGIIPETTNNDSVEKVYLPASTGIQGGNPDGAACVMDVLAVVHDSGSSLSVEHITGAKQKSAFRYGSAFSRAVSIREPNAVQVMVSGTASICDQGKSLFIGDIRAQIVKTLEVIEALIGPEGARLQDICDATVFLKKAEYLQTFREVASDMGLDAMPAVCVVADVCRDELLFEMDAIAAVVSNGGSRDL